MREPDGEPDELGRDERDGDQLDAEASSPGAGEVGDPAGRGGRGGDMDDASVDAAFADIVAWWKADAPPGGRPPAQTAESRPEPPERPRDPLGDRAPTDNLRTGDAARRKRIEREVDFGVDGPGGGHYTPPEPAPLPRLDLITVLAWVAVLAGPLVLLLAALVASQDWGGVPQWVVAVAVVATIGGFVVLASRLPRRGEQDPDDDGAVV